jgi:hypothetical protein
MRYTRAIAASTWTHRHLAVAGIGRDRSVFVRGVDLAPLDPAGYPPGAARPPASWVSLGGDFAHPPAIVSWEPGRLDLFAVAQGGAMYHRAWGTSDGWWPAEGWQNLGGEFTSPPVAVSEGTGRLDVFGLGRNRALWHKQWTGSGWQPGGRDWESLGGEFTSLPAVATMPGDRLIVCGLGRDGSAYLNARLQQHWAFPGWQSLGGRLTSVPAIIHNGSHVDILAAGVNDDLYRRHLLGPKDSDSWGWLPMNARVTSAPGAGRLDRPAQDGVLFALGQDLGVWHRTYTIASDGPAPEVAWASLGGIFTSAPAVVTTSGRRLDVFGLGLSTGVFHKTWDLDYWEPAGEDWNNLGGRFLHSTRTTTPADNGDPGTPTAGALSLSLRDQSAELDVLSASWRVWHQKPTGPELVRVLEGTSVSVVGLTSGQYLVRAEVAALNTSSGAVEAAEFRGNGASVQGAPTHVLVWSGSAQAHSFTLRSEARWVEGQSYVSGVVSYSG